VREIAICFVGKKITSERPRRRNILCARSPAVEARLLFSCFGLKKPAVPRTQGNLIEDSRIIAVPTLEKIEVESLGRFQHRMAALSDDWRSNYV
jgi:hypothetical protein